MTYKPLRTFVYIALVPGFIGSVLCLRFLYYFLADGRSGHIQSLILAAILLILSSLLVILGILSDLISANRQLIQETLFRVRLQEYRKSKDALDS